jgi:uncharacterized cupredoxin-like copper-binding protein
VTATRDVQDREREREAAATQERFLDEESPAIEGVMDSGSSLAPGETRVLGANLDPGSYVIVCNLPAHFRLGMHQTITVK